MINKFEHSRKALEVFDAGQIERDRLWATAQSIEDVDAANDADTQANNDVREAFYQDTKQINSRHQCHLADIGFIRHCVENAEAHDAK